MATLLEIFSLYKLTLHNNSSEYLLVRTEQPSYSSANQTQENIALKIETEKRQLLLNLYVSQFSQTPQIEFIGELQDPPIGDELFSENGLFKLPIFYQQTEYGFPWIILGTAENISSFQEALKKESHLLSLSPIGVIKQLEGTLITEKDFDISAVQNFNIKDIRDISL